jgi:hypothetical protein
MDGHRCRRVAALLAATLCMVAVHEGGCAGAARALKQAVEERTEPAASEAVLDVAAAEAPEGVTLGSGGGEEVLNAGKWLPMPMPLTLPAASGLRFPPVPPFPGAGASMPWLPAFAAPGGLPLPAFVPPYVGATRQEQLSLWASLFNPMQVRPRLPAGTLGPAVGQTTGGGQADRGTPAIAGSGKAVAEEEAMDVPAASAVPRWGVFFGNIDRRN